MRVLLRNPSDEALKVVQETLPVGSSVALMPDELDRYTQHDFATRGVVLFSNDEDDKESPMYAGGLHFPDKIKDNVDYVSLRYGFFKNKLPVNYVGRIYDDPKNIIVGDPDNMDVRQVLKYLPDNWWGSLGFLTAYKPRKLHYTFEMQMYYSKPIAITEGGAQALKATGLDFVDGSGYPRNREGGLMLREASRRDPVN